MVYWLSNTLLNWPHISYSFKRYLYQVFICLKDSYWSNLKWSYYLFSFRNTNMNNIWNIFIFENDCICHVNEDNLYHLTHCYYFTAIYIVDMLRPTFETDLRKRHYFLCLDFPKWQKPRKRWSNFYFNWSHSSSYLTRKIQNLKSHS